MENGQEPKKKTGYIAMDAVRRPFPYEMRGQRQTGQTDNHPDMQESAACEVPQEATRDSAARETQPESAQQSGPRYRTVFSSGKHTVTDFLTASNLLVIINVIVYIVMMRGKTPEDTNVLLVYRYGGMYVPAMRDEGEYYRLFTSMFLHFDLSHLLNNMLCLFLVGNILEEQLGRLRLSLVYLLGGLSGSIASYLYYLSRTEYPVGAGASGAVYAIYGGYLAMIMFDPRMQGRMNPWRFVILFLVTIFSQFSDSSIGNRAHFVGFLAGFLIATCIYLVDKKRKRGTYGDAAET